MAEVSHPISLNDSNNGRTRLIKSDRFDPVQGTPAWLRSELKGCGQMSLVNRDRQSGK
ncbi:MAG: hypothetical protein WBM44_30795 [Waterburya sp.]